MTLTDTWAPFARNARAAPKPTLLLREYSREDAFGCMRAPARSLKECHHGGVRIVVSDPATAAIHERGGRLYVWLRPSRCCRGAATLATATTPPAGKQFRKDETTTSFDLYLPTHLTHLPDELHVDVRGRKHRIEAYWNGCAWVT
jgi:hypothetical protein